MALGVIALLSLVVFGLGSASGLQTTFHLSTPNDFFTIPDFAVDARSAAIVLVALGTRSRRAGRRGPPGRGAAVGHVAAVALWRRHGLALLAWAGAGRDNTDINHHGHARCRACSLAGTARLRLAGWPLCERSGIINIAIEGQLLGRRVPRGRRRVRDAATPTLGWWRRPSRAPSSARCSPLFAVRYWVDQIVVGVVLNVLVVGLTSFLFGTVLTATEPNHELRSPRRDWAEPAHSGAVQDPVLGPVLFDQTRSSTSCTSIVIVFQIMLFKSRWGLRVRAVGEHPKAADTVGIKVNRTRVRNTILGGAIAGLGGAFFTVASSLAFGKEMTAGKGYIALAAMILGRWSPRARSPPRCCSASPTRSASQSRHHRLRRSRASSSRCSRTSPRSSPSPGSSATSRPPAAEGKPYKK